MIRPSVVLAGWAGLLGLLGLVLALFSPPQYAWALLVGAGIALAPIGALMLLPGRGREGRRALPDTSLPTVAIAAGIALLVLGLAAGIWLVGVGIEVLALGVFGLVMELRAQRRAAER
jgi:Cytochrome c oxidase subunit IV